MTDLSSLLNVKPSEVSGLLEEFKPNCFPFADTVNLKFYYIRFQNDLPRLDHFVKKLCDHIVTFCLDRDKLQDIKPQEVRRLYLEAKQKFSQPSDNKTGEPGELLLYFLIEGFLKAPKIFSKMSLKTNSQMHIHGSDGVHLGLDQNKVILYFGESKLYGIHTSAINEALGSVKTFISPLKNTSNSSQEDFEISILAQNLDLPNGPMRELVLQALDPYSEERSNLRYVYTCFIGFDMKNIANQCNIKDFHKAYQDKAKSCATSISKKLNDDPKLQQQSWQFFFLPFDSVDNFRRKFIEELKS